jgi:hypothetical protein
MRRCSLVASLVLLAVALAGCTGIGDSAAPTSGGPFASAASAAASSAGAGDAVLSQVEEGQDLGNGRPEVSNDGLMVRRRVVIAVHSDTNADLETVREKLDAAAGDRSMALEPISPTVLEPAVLQHVMPELIVALPASSNLDDGRAVADAVHERAEEGTQALAAEHFHVLPVLVHDLAFTIATPTPAALSAAVDREGILSDALGNYGTTVDGGLVTFSYTGPLLGDATVESVRAGIARQAHVAASAVAVGPRSLTGTGVDMAAEAPWDPEVVEEKPGHAHG